MPRDPLPAGLGRGFTVRRPFLGAGRAGVVFPVGNPYISPMRKESGFTLLELLVTVTVAAILLSIAIPNFRTTIANNRQTNQLNTMLSGLIYARSEAIKRNASVVICATTNQTACSGSSAWGSGWIVYYVPVGTSATAAPAAAAVIRTFPALSGSNTLNTNASSPSPIAAVSSGMIVFQSSGMTTLSNDAQFSLCDARGKSYSRMLMLGAAGRAEVMPTSPAPTWGGSALSPAC